MKIYDYLGNEISDKERVIPSDLKIICCGDSLTHGDYGSEPAGTANDHDENYPYFLAKYLEKTVGSDVINLGKNGVTPKSWYSTFSANSSKFQSGRIVVPMMFGANGGFTDTVDTDTSASITVVGYYMREIEEIISLSSGKAQIIIFGAPYVNPSTRPTNSANVLTANPISKKIAQKYNLPFVDTYYELGLNALNTSVLQPIDGLHFGYEGYSRLGTFIGSKILSLLSFTYDEES